MQADLFRNMGCFSSIATDREVEHALWYYNHGSAQRVFNASQQVKDLFKCYYHSSDYIYSYSTLWHEGYILVRKNKPIISVETK